MIKPMNNTNTNDNDYIECEYCGSDVPSDEPCIIRDRDTLAEVAAHHAKGCDWISTHGEALRDREERDERADIVGASSPVRDREERDAGADIVGAISLQAHGWELSGWGATEAEAQAMANAEAGDVVEVRKFVTLTLGDLAVIAAKGYSATHLV